jgi:hypothetical protein
VYNYLETACIEKLLRQLRTLEVSLNVAAYRDAAKPFKWGEEYGSDI